MPSPWRTIKCEWCGCEHLTRSKTARTCSKSCSARLRQTYAPNGRAPREYPSEVVDLVCGMYLNGASVAEIRAAAPKGYRVQTVLERYLEKRRPAIKRNQRAEKNDSWKGDSVGTNGWHWRLREWLGRANEFSCIDCGGAAAEWSYAYGCPGEKPSPRGPYCTHQEHYSPRCKSCHRRYDNKNRRYSR